MYIHAQTHSTHNIHTVIIILTATVCMLGLLSREQQDAVDDDFRSEIVLEPQEMKVRPLTGRVQ